MTISHHFPELHHQKTNFRSGGAKHCTPTIHVLAVKPKNLQMQPSQHHNAPCSSTPDPNQLTNRSKRRTWSLTPLATSSTTTNHKSSQLYQIYAHNILQNMRDCWKIRSPSSNQQTQSRTQTQASNLSTNNSSFTQTANYAKRGNARVQMNLDN